MFEEQIKAYRQVEARRASFKNTVYETPGQHQKAYIRTEPFIEFFAVLNNLQINGGELLPKEGPGIFGLIHTHWRDLFALQWLPAVTVGRTVRTFCRASLLDLDYKEVEEAQKTRTQHSFMSDDRLAGFLSPFARRGRQAFADYLRCFDIIPVEPYKKRSTINLQAIRTVDEELKRDHLVAAFVQPHRKPQLDLLDYQRGVDVMMERNPNVPFYPVAFSGLDKFLGQWVINIGHPFTYTHLMALSIMPEQVMDYLVDQIAMQVADPDLIPAWRLNRQAGFPIAILRQMGDANIDLKKIARQVLGDQGWRIAALAEAA